MCHVSSQNMDLRIEKVGNFPCVRAQGRVQRSQLLQVVHRFGELPW